MYKITHWHNRFCWGKSLWELDKNRNILPLKISFRRHPGPSHFRFRWLYLWYVVNKLLNIFSLNVLFIIKIPSVNQPNYTRTVIKLNLAYPCSSLIKFHPFYTFLTFLRFIHEFVVGLLTLKSLSMWTFWPQRI